MDINRLKRYINEEHPLGPSDASQIDDIEVAASLFDPHYSSFNILLRKDISVVTGRRGSGKTALLNSYIYKRYLQNSIFLEESNDLRDYQIVIPIQSFRHFDRMQPIVLGQDRNIQRSIEGIIDEWKVLIQDYVIAHIAKELQEDGYEENLQSLLDYLNNSESGEVSDIRRKIWGPGLWEFFVNIFKSRSQLPTSLSTSDEAIIALDRMLSRIMHQGWRACKRGGTGGG